MITSFKKIPKIRTFARSALAYYVLMLVAHGMTTTPIYANETVKLISLTIQYLHLSLPLVTLVYLAFLNAKNKEATAIQVNLHWAIFGLSLLTFFIMQNFERN